MVEGWLNADPTRSSQDEPAHHHSNDEWSEILARTIAHLAAQLTMTQLRLRALATEFESQGGIDAAAVQSRLNSLAETETGTYLRENLGDALAEVVDIDALKVEIATFLRS